MFAATPPACWWHLTEEWVRGAYLDYRDIKKAQQKLAENWNVWRSEVHTWGTWLFALLSYLFVKTASSAEVIPGTRKIAPQRWVVFGILFITHVEKDQVGEDICFHCRFHTGIYSWEKSQVVLWSGSKMSVSCWHSRGSELPEKQAGAA